MSDNSKIFFPISNNILYFFQDIPEFFIPNFWDWKIWNDVKSWNNQNSITIFFIIKNSIFLTDRKSNIYKVSISLFHPMFSNFLCYCFKSSFMRWKVGSKLYNIYFIFHRVHYYKTSKYLLCSDLH